MTYKEQLTAIAKVYCNKNRFNFLFVNETDATFGYETEDGHFVHKSFYDLAEELGLEV